MIIKYLPLQEAQKIAAGEVVERPSNIVKELIENALDAGATKITLTLEDGGKSNLTITDNGCGMEVADARICFLRHTTSKITTFDELQNVLTFGFRGEALASICSVAQVTLTTRHTNSEHALKLSIENGVITQETIIGAPLGTTIEIKDLFYNVPARKKFLKTTTTELNQTLQLFKAFCLSNLAVHFLLSHNGSIVYSCPEVTSIDQRIAQLFEPSLSKQLCDFSATDDSITCSGALTGAHYSRYDRNGIFMFVNNRWIKNYGISQAIMKGYMNVLQPQKYPLIVLNITINSTEVDINTHPKKEEVVFLHRKTVEHLITNTVKQTLEAHISQRLQQSSSFPQSYNSKTNPFQHFASEQFSPKRSVFKDLPLQHTYASSPFPDNVVPSAPVESTPQISFPLPEHAQPFAQESHIEESLSAYTILGQLHLTYLLLEHPEGLLLIDQHAAHERILYEKIAASFTQQETISLLFPETISLQKNDLEELLEYLPLLHDHGIMLEQISVNELVLRSKPVYSQAVNITELLQHIIGWIRDYGKAEKDAITRFITEKMRAQIACKAAIKAGDLLSQEKMQALLKDLNGTTNRFACPHGRPTSWLLPLFEIEKKFKRKL